MKRTCLSAVVVMIVLGLLVAACAPSATPTPRPKATQAAPAATKPPERKTFKIGVLGPFTGPNARTGDELQNGFKMAFDNIDWKIGDYDIEYVWIDSESDPEKGARAYESAAMRDKIDCGFAGWHSSVAVACMDIVAKYKIPHFFHMGASQVVSDKYESDREKYGYWVAKGWANPIDLVAGYVETLEGAIASGIWTPKHKVAVFLFEDSDWCRTFGDALAARLEESGWIIAGQDFVPIGESDLYPLLSKYQAMDPAPVLLATSSNPPVVNSLVKQSRELGMKTLLAADGLGWLGEWYELTGEASDYCLDMIPQWGTDEARAFRDAYIAEYNLEPSPTGAALQYDNANFLIKIAQRAYEKYGELSSETLYKVGQEEVWTGELSYKGGLINKEYKYLPETVPDLVVGPEYFMFPVIQYFDGEGVIVWPEYMKEADLKIPPYMLEE